MKKEFREIYENIKPDEELLMNALDLTDKKMLKQRHIVRKVVSCVLCLAAFVGAGVGIRDNFIQNEAGVAPTQSLAKEPKITKGGVLVAYAQTNELVRLNDELELSEMPLFGNITIIDLNAPQNEIDEKNEYFEKVKKDIEAEFDKLGNEGKGIGMRQGGAPLDNVQVRRIILGDFILDLPDDYSEIESLKIYNTCEYADVVLAIDTNTDDDFSVEYRHSNCVEATGQELQNSRDKRTFERGIGEHQQNSGYEITWRTSYKFSQAVEANPQFNITTLNDTITFEVVYKNGDVSKAAADISFDKNGNMTVQNGGYDYIQA